MTTTYKPYAAFGTAFVKCNAERGDFREVKLGANGLVVSGYYFYTNGVSQLKVKETGEVLEDRTAGWLNLDHGDSFARTLVKNNTSGTLMVTYPVDTEWFCISHQNNQKGLPDLSAVIIEPSSTHLFEVGSNVFLARGELDIHGKMFIGPCQIRVRTGPVTVVNNTDSTVYALLVK